MNWTIAVITDGKAEDRVEKIFISFLNQKGMDTTKNEFLIVGGNLLKYPYSSLVSHIQFDESIKDGWITKKKNLAFQIAKHNNILILHDYIFLDKEWYLNFESFNDDWDICVPRIEMKDGTRYRDWVTWDTSLGFPNGFPHSHCIRYIDYHDHSQIKNQYVSGAGYCIKKNFALKYPLDENKTWAQSEDVAFSTSVRAFWNLKCNPRSILRLMKDKDVWPPRRLDYNWKDK